MINIVGYVISDLIGVLIQFLNTDIAMVFIGVIVVAILIRCLIMLFSFGKGVFK